MLLLVLILTLRGSHEGLSSFSKNNNNNNSTTTTAASTIATTTTTTEIMRILVSIVRLRSCLCALVL